MFLKPQQKQPKEAPKPAVNPALQPWVEKYRPKTIDEISSQEHTVKVLRRALTSTNLPHMLFYGPPGTGKTSTILALARQLFGPENFRSRVLELNASDERGISVVRDKIKTFAKQTPRAIEKDSRYPCPPFKIVILDEADSMTQDAQGALRRTMETYARITRFCLVCNYVTRIIEPIASRCSKFRFKPLDIASSRVRLIHIATEENIDISPEVVDKLIETSSGDLRRAITYMQSAARLSTAGGTEIVITPREIEEIAGVVPTATLDDFASALGIEPIGSAEPDAMDVDEPSLEGVRASLARRQRATTFDDIKAVVKTVIQGGFSVSQLIRQLHKLVIKHPIITDRQKADILLLFGEVDKSLVDGGDEELQLLDVALRISKIMKTTS
ncbi:hypothetical protein FRB99_006111 [Tulasnella sp. 403]|nr:hypothetical protein FRB99_006111 [Tulasnella sp. 403]